ncbi:hypothetical protein ILUMI_16632 [Ignelater luminosus]|uniref:Integrase catalytic domain-containing protein n=1 Tax=Ignelater luminosus TaxID=2038154 RepID=A0A8K0CQX3_IGNLU|nr:hypothetical protein ILUMI_16632 [Ignelater luminosus]
MYAKYERNPLKIVPNVTETSSRPFEIINIDLFFMDNQIFLTIIDQFSRFLQMYPIQSQNQVEIMDQLTKFVSTFPTPSKIIADNQFDTVVFKEFCSLYKIVYHFTTPRRSTGNSYVERTHSTIIEHFRLMKQQDKNVLVANKYPLIVLAYNDTIHSSTKLKPRDIVFGHIQQNYELFERQPQEQLKNNYVERQREIMQILYQQIKEREQLRKQTANEKAKEKLNEDKTKDIHNKEGFENLKPRVKIQHKFKPMKIVADSGQVVITDKDKKVHKSDLKVRKYRENHDEDSSN